jgi:hypothetical protein
VCSSDLEYRYIETIVTTAEAQHLVRRCVQAVEAKKKVLVAFRLNDMKARPYIRTKGEDAGKPAAALESRLIHIGSIKVDGQQVYREPSRASAEPEASAPAEAFSAQDDDGDPRTAEDSLDILF